MQIWKLETANSQLIEKMNQMSEEMQRLQKVSEMAGSIGRLPKECLTKEIDKKFAHSDVNKLAVKQYKDDKKFEQVTKEIDDLAEKSKKAYVRLYEQVGE